MSNRESRNKKIDRIDQEIIKLLQVNGRLSNSLIAKKTGISEATVRNRLNRLINDEYIQIVAVSNPLKLGFNITGVIKIVVDIGKIDAISNKLKKLSPLWFIVHSTGGSDIYGEFVAKSIDELKGIYAQIDPENKIYLYCNKGKQSSLSYLIMRKICGAFSRKSYR